MVREVVAKKITETVKNLCIEAATNLPEDVLEALNKALAKEESHTGREILRQLILNAKIAWRISSHSARIPERPWFFLSWDRMSALLKEP